MWIHLAPLKEGAHSPSWPNGLLILLLYPILYSLIRYWDQTPMLASPRKQRLVLPAVSTFATLVEGGFRLVGRTRLHLQKVRLPVLARRAAHLSAVHIRPGLFPPKHVFHRLNLKKMLLDNLTVYRENIGACLAGIS